MATNLMPFRPSLIGASTTSGNRKPESVYRKSSSSNWWTPLFGWSSEPDYIDSENRKQNEDAPGKIEVGSDPDLNPKRTRFFPGCFTEEKARRLRMMTKESESFHDAMYHSAIASRLASDFKKSSDL